MKIFIGLVTADTAMSNYFSTKKDGVVPKDSLRRGFFMDRTPAVSVASYQPKGPPSKESVEKFLFSRIKDFDACIVLVDAGWENFIANLKTSIFTHVFTPAQVANYQNFFHQLIAQSLRSLGQLLVKFENANDVELLSLPLRNFKAGELIELTRLFQTDHPRPDFINLIDRQLSELRKRVRPRRRSEFKTTYAVDDMNRFFSYGKERHSRFATGDDHEPHCEIAGHFRFGRRIDSGRHYNVSETEGDKTHIRGLFFDCHGEQHDVKDKTHLNMFANDYF